VIAPQNRKHLTLSPRRTKRQLGRTNDSSPHGYHQQHPRGTQKKSIPGERTTLNHAPSVTQKRQPTAA